MMVTIAQQPVFDESAAHGLSLLFPGATNVSESQLATALDAVDPQANTIDPVDVAALVNSVPGLNQDCFLALVREYQLRFPRGTKRVDLWSLQPDDTDVHIARPTQTEPGRVHLGTGAITFVDDHTTLANVHSISFDGLVTCIGIVVWDPVTKRTFAGHYSFLTSDRDVPRWLAQMVKDGIPAARLRAQLFFANDYPSSQEKLAILENDLCAMGIAYSSQYLPYFSNTILFDRLTGAWILQDDYPAQPEVAVQRGWRRWCRVTPPGASSLPEQ